LAGKIVPKLTYDLSSKSVKPYYTILYLRDWWPEGRRLAVQHVEVNEMISALHDGKANVVCDFTVGLSVT